MAVATDAVGDGLAVVGAKGGSFRLADRRILAWDLVTFFWESDPFLAW